MPEGDTVHKIAAHLRKRLVGETLRGGRLRDHPRVRLKGRIVRDVRAHGKHLFVRFEDGSLLRSHLGMWGAWHRYRPGERWEKPARQSTILLEIEDETFVCFNAKEVELLRAGSVRDRRLRARLGQDLTAAESPDLGDVLARAREFLEPDTIVADVLLDQRVACGIGNVYKSEVLFLEGVHPKRTLGELTDEELGRLYERARVLLRKNLGPGHRVTRFARDAAGRLWVYGRTGRSCLRCGGRIVGERLGAAWRSTYWCERCQRRDGPSPPRP